jgi:predicted dehydrogenase
MSVMTRRSMRCGATWRRMAGASGGAERRTRVSSPQSSPPAVTTGKRFDVALVGCGGVAQMHLEGYALHPERVRVVAACDVDGARAEAAGRRWNIPAVFTSLAAMLQGASWEVAVVCTPTPVREAVVRDAAGAGKHLFVEKPLADSYEEARQMVAICERAGVRLAVDQNFRFHYPFHQARTLIEAGRLGRVVGITHQDLFFRQDSGWRTRRPRHALAVMGIHWLDGFRWMLRSEARSLICQTQSSAAIECAGETDAFLQIGFENGASAAYVQSFSSPIARTETLILGEQGMLSLDYQGAALFQREAGQQPAERWANPYGGANKPESVFEGLNQLLSAIETEREPPNSGQDNLRTVALLEAAYRSAAEQQIIHLPSETEP